MVVGILLLSSAALQSAARSHLGLVRRPVTPLCCELADDGRSMGVWQRRLGLARERVGTELKQWPSAASDGARKAIFYMPRIMPIAAVIAGCAAFLLPSRPLAATMVALGTPVNKVSLLYRVLVSEGLLKPINFILFLSLIHI